MRREGGLLQRASSRSLRKRRGGGDGRLLLCVSRGVLGGVEPLDGLERVDGHQDRPGAGVDLVPVVAEAQVVGDGGLVEVGERANVLGGGILGRGGGSGVGRQHGAQGDAHWRGVAFAVQLDQTAAVCRGLF